MPQFLGLARQLSARASGRQVFVKPCEVALQAVADIAGHGDAMELPRVDDQLRVDAQAGFEASYLTLIFRYRYWYGVLILNRST